MNNNYMYPNYQGNSMGNNIGNLRFNQMRGNSQQAYDGVLSPHIGKTASFYLTFTDSTEWRDTIFKGTIQDSNDDYTLITDATTGKPILVWNKYINYIIFDENVNL